MSVIEDRIRELGFALPAVFSGPPSMSVKFDLVRIAGDVAYISGHGPMDGSRLLISGRVGEDPTGDWLSPEAGYEAARLTALSMLASLKSALGDLDRVSGWLKVLGFVSAAPGFNKTPAVIDGFTDLVLELWGESGRHARSAIGVAELPFGIPVEVEAIVAIR